MVGLSHGNLDFLPVPEPGDRGLTWCDHVGVVVRATDRPRWRRLRGVRQWGRVGRTQRESIGRVDITSYQSVPSGGRASFTVAASPPPHLTVSSNWIGQGGILKVNGSGFAPSEQVTLTFGGVCNKTFPASATGTLAAVPITIVPADRFGPQTQVATGVTSGRSTTATFNISNAWSQFLHTSTRHADDPGDKVFQKRLSVSSGTYLGQAGSFMSGAAVRTSVSMVNGVAYFGNDAGAV